MTFLFYHTTKDNSDQKLLFCMFKENRRVACSQIFYNRYIKNIQDKRTSCNKCDITMLFGNTNMYVAPIIM